MISVALALGVGVLATSSLISGVALVMVARVPGIFLGAGGACGLAGVLLDRTGHLASAHLLYAVGAGLCAPLALATYPRRGRHVIDRVLVALIGVAGLTLVAAHRGWAGHAPTETLVLPAAALVCLVVVQAWWRLERGEPDVRRALTWTWLALGTATMLLFVADFTIAEQASTPVARAAIATGIASFGFTGPALVIGARRPEAVDVRALVVGTVVTLTALVAYVGAFGVVQGVLETTLDRTPSVGALALAGGLLAVLFHPFRAAMRDTVDQLPFGRRPDPLGAAGQVAAGISSDPAAALDVVRTALVLPWLELQVAGEVVASSGEPVPHLRTFPLPGRHDAELVIGVRPGDLGLSDADTHVLRLVTPLLAQTLHARALADDLQESREQTITAIEEERRRLRRDLHDGLGPRLSGIAYTADAVRNQLGPEQAAADQLVQTLRAEVGTAIREIRELVYAMRPPALDELGLLPAVLQATSLLRTQAGELVTVEVDAPDLPPLPAAVEVAAYRIVVEAVRNIARHSTSPHARVRVCVTGEALEIVVADGGGPSEPWRAGVGISSMRERAEELGGSLELEQLPEGGRVRAMLPLPA